MAISIKKSCIFNICQFRGKFNEALNSSISKISQYMLTIASCNSYDDFDKHGCLSKKCKMAFWDELDDLIDRFDRDKVKLLPTPSQPLKTVQKTWHHDGGLDSRGHMNFNFKHPLQQCRHHQHDADYYTSSTSKYRKTFY